MSQIYSVTRDQIFSRYIGNVGTIHPRKIFNVVQMSLVELAKHSNIDDTGNIAS